MKERELPGMEHLSAHSPQNLSRLPGRDCFPSPFFSIFGVPDYCMAHGCTVDANLVGPPCLQIDFKESHTGKALFYLPARLSRPTLTALCGHLFSIFWMAPYWKLDHPCSCLHLPLDESQVHLTDLAHLELTA